MFTRKDETHEPTTYEVTKSDQEWKDVLPADRYAVLRRAGTEPAWSGDLLHVDGDGVFRCAGCGAELFDTDAKFDSVRDGRASTGPSRPER
jgi:peptide-methionine (R)-S-oxide reductase